MWVIQKENGCFSFRERFKNPLTGKSKIYSITLSKNTAAIRKEAMAILQERFNSDLKEVSKIYTLKELSDIYLDGIREDIKASTFSVKSSNLSSAIRLLGCTSPSTSLSSGYIRQKLKQSGKSASTLNSHLRQVLAMCRWLYRNDYLDNIDFCDKLSKFKEQSPPSAVLDKFLEEEEARSIVEYFLANNKHIYAYFTKFMLLTGMRSGELIALEKADIDFANNIITISKTYDQINAIVTSAKTVSSTREIPLTPSLRHLIFDIEKYYKSKRLALFTPKTLFKGIRHDYFVLRSYNVALRKACSVLGISKNVTSHTLRHTYASLLMEKGVPIDYISRILGHHDSKITRDIYLHVTNKLKDREFEMLRNISIL